MRNVCSRGPVRVFPGCCASRIGGEARLSVTAPASKINPSGVGRWRILTFPVPSPTPHHAISYLDHIRDQEKALLANSLTTVLVVIETLELPKHVAVTAQLRACAMIGVAKQASPILKRR